MKNKLAQLQVLASKIDRRYLQLAYFVFIFVGLIVVNGPSDGSGGPFAR